MGKTGRCDGCDGRFDHGHVEAIPVGPTEDDPWAGGATFLCATCVALEAALPRSTTQEDE